jgi:hypothetical protein
MKKTVISIISIGMISATLAAYAHHPSPADPDIGDAMGMHEDAIAAMMDRRSETVDTDSNRSDLVGTNIRSNPESGLAGPGNTSGDEANNDMGGSGVAGNSMGGIGGDGVGGGASGSDGAASGGADGAGAGGSGAGGSGGAGGGPR